MNELCLPRISELCVMVRVNELHSGILVRVNELCLPRVNELCVMVRVNELYVMVRVNELCIVIRVNELCVLVRVNELYILTYYVVVRVNEFYVVVRTHELCVAVRVNEPCVVVRVNELCMVASEVRNPHVIFVKDRSSRPYAFALFSPVELPPFILSTVSPFLYSFFSFLVKTFCVETLNCFASGSCLVLMSTVSLFFCASFC